jgi:hypothetical protein
VDEAEVAIRGPAEACPFCSVALLVPAAIACARAGDTDRAQAYLASAEAVVGMLGPASSWNVAVTEAAAHVASAPGDMELAAELFARAHDGYRRAGQPLDAARCAPAAATPIP